jgi:hypothetical protein
MSTNTTREGHMVALVVGRVVKEYVTAGRSHAPATLSQPRVVVSMKSASLADVATSEAHVVEMGLVPAAMGDSAGRGADGAATDELVAVSDETSAHDAAVDTDAVAASPLTALYRASKSLTMATTACGVARASTLAKRSDGYLAWQRQPRLAVVVSCAILSVCFIAPTCVQLICKSTPH